MDDSAKETLINKLINYQEIKLNSPAELRVYDSQSQVTGMVNGEIKNDISNSDYYEGIVVVFLPSDSYRYEVVGTDEGSYGLGVTAVRDGEATTFTATDIPTAPGTIHRYAVDWDALTQGGEGVTVEIDSDGDGEFEKTIITDGELSRDEVPSILQLGTNI